MYQPHFWWIFRCYFAVMAAYLLMPVVVVVLASFSDSSYLTIPPRGFTLRWYSKVFTDSSYRQAFFLSLTLAGAAVAMSLAIGTISAYAITRFPRPWLDGPLASFLLSPLVFPGVVVGVALLRIYAPVGLLGSFWGMLGAHAVITTPYTLRCVMTALSANQLALEDVARTLGASRPVAFATVTLPMLRTGLLAAGIMSFIVSFDNVPVTIFLLGARQQTIPVRIFNQLEYGSDPSVAAVSTLLIAGTALVLFVAERIGRLHRYV